MPSGYNALAARPQNRLAYPGQDVVNAFTQGLGPMLYGAAKGTAAAVAGMPGDIEQLARQLLLSGAAPDSYTAKNMAAQALLPTSDRVRAMLPSLPNADPQAQYSENMGATLGQNVAGNLVAPKALPAAAQMAGEGAMATGRFVAPKAGQLAEQYMVRTGGILPLDVYHGTPHTLPPTPNNPLGEFDASKIGTGEGAQAYGHGIYTSEAPSVAKSYQSSVSAMHKAQGKSVADVTIQGNPIDWDNPVQVAAFELERHNGDRLAAAEFHAKNFAGGENNPTVKILKSKQKLPSVDLPGNLYKIDLPDEKIAKMLDWDKPLSEQPEILAAIKRAGYKPNPEMKAGDFIAATSKEGFAPYLSDDLVKQGIPGIQYLDQGSRSAGAGTRNFVVFPGEEKSMTILERNGQPAQMSVADQIDNINEVLKKKRKK
jgi:hypothetical protein